MKYRLKKSSLIFSGIIAGLAATAAQAQLVDGSEFASLLKSPNKCINGTCPAGAYFVKSSDGADVLNKLGTKIGGPQDGSRPGLTSQWSDKRYAILIEGSSAPYTMAKPFKIGYYTQILGVGTSKNSTTVAPGINVLNECDTTAYTKSCKTVGALNNFWRGMENLTIDSSNLKNPDGITPAGTLRFAVSQASPIRNVDFKGKDLLMCDWNVGQINENPDHSWPCGFASGGFMANSHIDKELQTGSQQQFYVTDTSFSNWKAGNWNMVSHNNQGPLTIAGEDGSTQNSWGDFPFTDIKDTLTIPDKPRLVYTQGDWRVDRGDGSTSLSVKDSFVVISPQSSTTEQNTQVDAQKVSSELSQGKSLIVMPGVYDINGTIKVPANTTVLGIGVPSLVCNSGQCIDVEGEQGVRLAGITLEAGTARPSSDPVNTLLKVGGDTLNSNDNSMNPDVLQDVYCRIARTTTAMTGNPAANSCVTVNANNTIGQNLWLWRADHDAQSGTSADPENNLVGWDTDQAEYGLIVNGKDVVMNGLAVEHFQNYQTVWNGQGGQINFYQSEMPYLMPINGGSSAQVKCSLPGQASSVTKQVCPSLIVTDKASGFVGKGLGVYSYFPNAQGQTTIHAPTAIEVKATGGVSIEHVMTRWLNGDKQSGIDSILTDASGNTYPVNSAVNGTTLGYALNSFSS
ncbi:glycosyl hydrolase family 28-related protein [Dongshaea marina]|uniref:glycosyl hydrolase family 28-related protein n=1 Tax=Dongshaea marina TaxID=2047966 RepID=UPI000D3EA5AA|nr:hypothetical protein [Dongshaea marina]